MPPPLPGDPAPPATSAPTRVPAPAYGQVPWHHAQPRRRVSRRLVLPSALTAGAVAVGAVLVAAFGLGSGGSTLSNAQLLAVVHSASHGLTRSPATAFTMTVDVSAQGHQETVDMQGATSRDGRQGSFTMTGPGIAESAVVDRGIVYVSVPPAALSLNDGKPWIGVRSVAPTVAEQQLGASGPAAMLESLAEVGGTVKDEGEQTVQGVPTTEYSVTVNVSQALASEDPELAKSLDLDGMGIGELPMTIWIDRQGLPRRMAIATTFNGVSLDEVANFTPAASVPDVQVPPASQVRMFNSLSDFTASMQNLYG
ncbi:MAG TPA: hypothetical protein VHB69_03360 [Mycobacteriales bacterium]|nr:hypothetical protein [Mycobacteriales bacterium]